MKWKISSEVILRRGEGFYELELLYFVVFLNPLINWQDARKIWVAYSIKTLYFSYVLVSLSVKSTILAEDLYLS